MKLILLSESSPETILATVDYKIVPPPGIDFPNEFCEVQPQIREYALANKEQMATIMIFVLASIMTSWGRLLQQFPDLMFRLYQDGVIRKTKEEKLTYAWIVHGKEEAIQRIWDNRDSLYDSLAPLIEEHKKTKNEFLVLELYRKLNKLQGLGLPKAAFLVQLLIGRLGCIDSINANIYKASFPDSLVKSRDPLQFKRTAESAKTGELTAGSEKLLKDYQDFINDIFEANAMQTSRLLWNNWTAIVAEKIRFRNKKGKIAIVINQGDEREARLLDPYPSNEFRRIRGGLGDKNQTYLIDPYQKVGGGAEDIYRSNPELSTASGVSRTHHPLNIHPHLKLEEILFGK